MIRPRLLAILLAFFCPIACFAIAPIIVLQPISRNVDEGESVGFMVIAVGSLPMNYQWQKDGVNLSGETGLTCIIRSAKASDAGSYRLVISNKSGTKTSSSARLTVYTKPVILTQPVSQNILVGQPVGFSITVSGNPAPTFQWYKNGAAIAGATGASYAIGSATARDSGTYSVIAKNRAGQTTSSGAVLSVQSAAPPVITTQPASASVQLGQSVTFTVVAEGTGELSYQWLKNGAPINGASDASYSIASASFADAGSFVATVSNAAGTTSSNAAVLTVTENPNLPPVVSLIQPATNTDHTLSVPIMIAASATDSDGAVSKVEFFNGPAKLGEAFSAPYTITWTAVSPCRAFLTAVATDDRGATTVSLPVEVSVLPRVPYTADFEAAEGYTLGDLNGQQGWRVGSGGAQVVDHSAARGSQSVAVSGADPVTKVVQRIGASAADTSIMYVDVYSKPAAGADPASGTLFDFGGAQLVCLQDGAMGRIAAFVVDGAAVGSWRSVGPTFTVDSNSTATAWLRLSARLNYVAGTFDVYVNGTMVEADLKFAQSGASRVSAVALRGAANAVALLDDLYVGAENPLFSDNNNNGLDDTWETAHGLSLTADNRSNDPDGDFQANVQEYVRGTNPGDYFNGSTPSLEIVSGDGQTAPPGQYNAEALVVAVKDMQGTLLVNAPVTFSVVSGEGRIAAAGSSPEVSLLLRTQADGRARVSFLQPPVFAASRIQAVAAGARVEFSSSAGLPPRIGAGGDQSLYISTRGVLCVWGRNSHAQLADGSRTSRATVRAITSLTSVVTGAGFGENHGFATDSSGSAFAWGGNYFGQLGDGSTTTRRSAVKVSGLSDATKLVAGDHHTLVLRSDGTVWAWGGNQAGQLGDGTTSNRATPVQVPGLANIVAIAAGAMHSVALRSDGAVFVWGGNEFGQQADEQIRFRSSPTQVQGLGQVTAIASGRHHVLTLKSDGSMMAWGANQSGQLGIGSIRGQSLPQLVLLPSAAASMAAGASHSVAIATDGTVLSWGANDVGQLGDGTQTARTRPTPNGLSGVVQIAAGRDHVVALTSTGGVFAWGDNSHGQIGEGAGAGHVTSPVSISVPSE